MKIKLSKKQWERIGKTAGWDSSKTFAVREINSLIAKLNALKDDVDYLNYCYNEPEAYGEIPQQREDVRAKLEMVKNQMLDVETTVKSEAKL